MIIKTFSTVEEARALLSGSRDRIISRLPPDEVMKRAAKIVAGVYDFCGSLTSGSQWTELKKFLPDDLRKQDDADRDWYLMFVEQVHKTVCALNHPDWFIGNGIHPNRTAIEGAWAARSFQRFIDGEMRLGHFVEAGKNVRLRKGTHALFQLTDSRVIISMGIEQIIRTCLDYNGLTSAIAATRMNFDPNGKLIGYNPNVVVSATKKVAFERFMHLEQRKVHECLVLGDSFIDLGMMPEGAFNVWILPHTEEYSGIASFRDTHFEAMLKGTTIVLYSNSLTPLVKLIQEARTSV